MPWTGLEMLKPFF